MTCRLLIGTGNPGFYVKFSLKDGKSFVKSIHCEDPAKAIKEKL